MQFIDCHCHLHDKRIIKDIDAIVNRALSAGVCGFVTCATAEDNFDLTARLAQKYEQIIPCFGIHPWFVDTCSDRWQVNLEAYLLNNPSGVGETGLDFTNKAWDREKQIRVFEHHLDLAGQLKRPVNIHIRKAWDTLIHILKKRGRLDAGGLVHSYSGSADLVGVLDRYNLHISFSGSVTNPVSKKVIRALQETPDNRFVLETDTPDINPYVDGVRIEGLNEPVHLPVISKIAADRIGMPFERFADLAFENTKKLFHRLMR